MKNTFTLLILLTASFVYGQTDKLNEQFRNLEPAIWMGIWDKENSDKSMQIDTLSYDDIPKYLEFRGTVVQALKWIDSLGENILIQSVTGQFLRSNNIRNAATFLPADKSELYAYLFVKKSGEETFKSMWKVYDYNECFGVDWFTGFIPEATTVTDLDEDGISEISMPYVLICRGGMDPGTMKIILYEQSTKYALRGTTKIICIEENSDEGLFEPSENLSNNKLFLNYLTKRWDTHKCENGRFY